MKILKIVMGMVQPHFLAMHVLKHFIKENRGWNGGGVAQELYKMDGHKIQKIKILTALCYCIWDAKQTTTKSANEIQCRSVSRQQEHKINFNALDHHLNPGLLILPALGKVNL